MSSPNAAIHVNVDVTNPGQFFACCGLLELADRLWPGATGWFDADQFRISCDGTLPELISQLSQSRLTQVDPESNTSSPIRIEAPFHLLLDWWHDRRSGGRELKVWAGTMESVRIAKAMQAALKNPVFQSEDLLNEGTVTYDVENPSKKVEPYYFDARRGPNAHSRDVGFSSNALGLTTTAAPAVELLCLIGLQRSRPALTNQPRIFRYFTWNRPVSPPVLPLVVNGLSHAIRAQGFQFENWYRTGQKKHKAFLPATPLNEMR
jgi:CRISPR-associated protein Csb3